MDKKPVVSVTKKDLEFEFFRAGGKGGQKQNKTSSGVRVRHRVSGAVGECRETRSQHKNKAIAFKRMAETETFQRWIKMETMRRIGQDDIDEAEIERRVEEQLKHVKVEGKDEEGRWKPL